MLVQAGLHYHGWSLHLGADVIEIVRFKNQEMTDLGLLYEVRDSNGNDLRVALEADWTPARFLTLFARGHLKHLSPNDHPVGDPLHQGRARLWGGGGGASVSLGGRVHLVLRADRWEGSAEDGAVQLTALNLRGTLTLEF
jgi:hypothetical protein